MRDIIAETNAQRERDRVRYAEIDRDLCMLCGAYGADKRSLSVNCFYAVNEVVPEMIDLHAVEEKPGVHRGFYMLICKSCRARFLGHLEEWRTECIGLRGRKKDHDGYLEDGYMDDDPGASPRDIPVRENGIIVYLTREEWEARRGVLG